MGTIRQEKMMMIVNTAPLLLLVSLLTALLIPCNSIRLAVSSNNSQEIEFVAPHRPHHKSNNNRQEQPTCNQSTHNLCQRCTYTANGVASPEYYCAPISETGSSCPPLVCCDIRTEETCYDVDTTDSADSSIPILWPISCAKRSEGGCPCPKHQVKCGINEYNPTGNCIDHCCDWQTEHTCHYIDIMHGNKKVYYCKSYDEGTCPTTDEEEDDESSEGRKEEDSSSSSNAYKDFTIRVRTGKRKSKKMTFHYLQGKCVVNESRSNKLPMSNVSLKRCAKKCANYGNDCMGIEYVENSDDGGATCQFVDRVDEDDVDDDYCSENRRLYSKEDKTMYDAVLYEEGEDSLDATAIERKLK